MKGVKEVQKKKFEIKETIFKKCPICKKGKVQKIKPLGFMSFTKSEEIFCDKCRAIFDNEDDIDGERAFSLDLSESNKKSKYNEQALKISEWNRGISDLDFCIKTNSLPDAKIKGLNVMLNSNEKTHYYSISDYMEERAIRHTYGGSVRIVKGVYIGGRRGESHGELRIIDKGGILLTNQRVIFNGNMRNCEYKLNKIISLQEYGDAIELGVANRKKVQVFKVEDPHKWATYIKIAIQNIDTDKKKTGKTKNDSDLLGILKVRYAKGEITKRQFDKMKKDLT